MFFRLAVIVLCVCFISEDAMGQLFPRRNRRRPAPQSPPRPAQNFGSQPKNPPASPIRNPGFRGPTVKQPTPANGAKPTPRKSGKTEEVIEEEITTNLPKFWDVVKTPTNVNLRGLHAVSQTCIWACGSKGTVVRTIDGGETWKAIQIKGAEQAELRDIHVVDENVALVLSSRNPARIYQTTDGGSSWDINYEHADNRVAFSSFEFWDDSHGMMFGNPSEGRLNLLMTNDGGISWQPLKEQYRPQSKAGERGFAASGSNMTISPKGLLMIGMGGAGEVRNSTSRVVFSKDRGASWSEGAVPMELSSSQGIFSLAFPTAKDGVAIGGNYKNVEDRSSNFAVTTDGGETWSTPTGGESPHGFRSCIDVWNKGRELVLVTVGPNGTDISTDLGRKWRLVSKQGFNVVNFTEDGRTGWAAGAGGRVARCVGR